MNIKVVEKTIDMENDKVELKITVPKEMVEEYEEDELKEMVKSFIEKETTKMLDEYNTRLIYEWLGNKESKE